VRAREQQSDRTIVQIVCVAPAPCFERVRDQWRPSDEIHRGNPIGSFVSGKEPESTQPLKSTTMDADNLNLSSDLMASASGYCLTTEEMAFLPPSLNILKNEHGFSRWISSLSLSRPPQTTQYILMPTLDSRPPASPRPHSLFVSKNRLPPPRVSLPRKDGQDGAAYGRGGSKFRQ
jgi:hypothetical protein